MTRNIGLTDRNVRIALAVLLLILAIVLSGAARWGFGVAALVLAGTAFVGTCPVYLPFGISTRAR